MQIKGLIKLSEADNIESHSFNTNDFDLDLEDEVLQPVLTSIPSVSNLVDHRLQVGDSPTSTSLTLLVNEDLPLNEKQQLVVERVLLGALTWKEHAYDATKCD